VNAHNEERLLHSTSLQTASSILAARQRAERELIAANEALTESNARLRLAMDSAHLGEWELDAATDSITLGPRAAQIYGLEPGIRYARSQLRELSHPQDAAMVRQVLEQALADHQHFNLEYRVLRRDGGVRWSASSGRGRYAPDGTLLGMTGVMQDITERRHDQEALRQREQLHRVSFELAPLGMAYADLDGRFIKVNAKMCQITGYAADELLEMNVADMAHLEDRLRDAEPLDALLRGRSPFYQSEKRYLRKDGGIRWVSVTARVVIDDDGSPLHSIGVVQDITDRKRFESDLKEAKAAAEHATLAKSEFLSSMSHELRSPLNSILGFAQLMESGSPPPSLRQKASIDQILQAGWHLLALINEVLDLASIESGKLSLSLQPLSLVDVLGECQAMIEPQAVQGDVRVNFHPVDGPGLILADRTRTKQVLINLLTNAIKYNRPSGTVDLRCSPVGARRVRVSVDDTGHGMTPAQLAQLFQPFNRLGREGGAEEGTGIGLVVSKRLIELMGGAIGVQSSVGVGSTFWIELDAIPAPQLTTGPAHDTPVDPHAPQPGTGPFTILCVEDNPANLLLVEEPIARRSDIRLLSKAPEFMATLDAALAFSNAGPRDELERNKS
jgi:PAS domain S-box-containing protein